MSLFLATLIELKAELGIEDVRDDAILAQHAEGLQGRFEAHLNRFLLRAENAVELFDGGAPALLLSRFPVESVASVYVSADQTWDATTLLEADDYRLSAERGRLYYGTSGVDRWPAGVANVRVAWTGGYVAVGTPAASGQFAMPAALSGAFRLQFGFEWRNRKTLGTQSFGAQGANVSLAPAKFLAAVEDALSSFRRI